jgi:hypothetical protein
MLENNGQVLRNSFLPRPPRRAPPARAPTRRPVYNTTRGVKNDRDIRFWVDDMHMSTSAAAHGVYETSYAWEPRRETAFWEDSWTMAASHAPSNRALNVTWLMPIGTQGELRVEGRFAGGKSQSV